MTSWWVTDQAQDDAEAAEGEYGEEEFADYGENEGEEDFGAQAEDEDFVDAPPEKEETAAAEE